MASPLTNFEELILWASGKIICGIGIAGFVVSVSFDLIARGMPIGQWQFDWLQITGIIGSIGLSFIGFWGDSFLNGPVRAIINEWAQGPN